MRDYDFEDAMESKPEDERKQVFESVFHLYAKDPAFLNVLYESDEAIMALVTDKETVEYFITDKVFLKLFVDAIESPKEWYDPYDFEGLSSKLKEFCLPIDDKDSL